MPIRRAAYGFYHQVVRFLTILRGWENMEIIDIIEFTKVQFALLSKGQLQTVRTAQQKKNRLYRQLQEKLRKEKHKLVKNGVFHSGLYDLTKERLTEEYEREVELIKECLLFYLHYSMKANQSDISSMNYEVDYSLPMEERLRIVKSFYESEYGNDYTGLLAAFQSDKVAPQYLGELYAALYDYFYEQAH